MAAELRRVSSERGVSLRPKALTLKLVLSELELCDAIESALWADMKALADARHVLGSVGSPCLTTRAAKATQSGGSGWMSGRAGWYVGSVAG